MQIKRRIHNAYSFDLKEYNKKKKNKTFNEKFNEKFNLKEKPFKNDEMNLLIQGIVSDKVCGALHLNFKSKILKKDHFSKYVQIPFAWLMNYFKKYGSAPKNTFEHVFKVEIRNYDPDTKILIDYIFDALNEQYHEEMARLEGSQNEQTEEYYITEMLPRFQILAESRLTRESLDKAELKGDTDQVKYILENFKTLNADSAESKGVEIMSLKDLEEEFEVTEPLWKQHLPYCEPIILEGREGTGKTSLATIITLDILRKFKDKIVVWLLCDSSPNDTKKLFYSFWTKQERKKYQKRLSFIKNHGEYNWNFSLHTNDDRLNLIEGLNEAIKKADGKEIAAVFIDSIRGMTRYSEKDSAVGQTMMDTIQPIICQRFKASIVYLHHWNKDLTKDDKDRSSGNTATRQAVRIVYALKETTYKNTKIVLATKPQYNKIPVLESTVDIDDDKKWILYVTPARENWTQILSSGNDTNNSNNNSNKQIDIAMTFLTEKFKTASKYFAKDIYKEGEKNDPPISSKTLLRAANRLKITFNKDSRRRSVWICKDFYETSK